MCWGLHNKEAARRWVVKLYWTVSRNEFESEVVRRRGDRRWIAELNLNGVEEGIECLL
jgi:hypothetical protein